jgi:hypothetical protein
MLESYRSTVPWLLHVAKTARPDLLFAAYLLAEHVNAPTTSHFAVATIVLMYLSKSSHMGITVGRSFTTYFYTPKSEIDDCLPPVFSYMDVVKDNNGRVRFGYVTYAHLTPVAWDSFAFDTCLDIPDTDAAIIAADAAIQSMLSIKSYMSVMERRHEEMFDHMTLLGDNAYLMRLFRNMVRQPYSSNKVIHTLGVQLKTYASSRVVKYAHADLQNNPARVLCRMLETNDFVSARKRLLRDREAEYKPEEKI